MQRVSKAKRVRAARRERLALEGEQMRLDARLRNARVVHVSGQPRRRVGDELQVLSRVELPDGRIVWYAAPQIGAFNLSRRSVYAMTPSVAGRPSSKR
jgi:hypothetical protein